MLSEKAVLHGVVDHTFVARMAADAVTVEGVWNDTERKAINALRVVYQELLAKEVNRIEGQLSLMVSHAEGEAESAIAKLKIEAQNQFDLFTLEIQKWKVRNRVFPFVLGFISGAFVLTVFLAVLLRGRI